MTNITELAQRMKAAAEKATPGEWWADEVKNEGCYGSGDDCVEGFTSYAIYGADGKTLFDSLNSDAACISEEYDGEGHVAWDETAQRNAEFIALANPANILALVEALEKAQGMETYWKTQCRGITDHCEELQARIAELESHTVKPPVHPTVASEKLDDETLQELIEFRRTTFEYHSKEGNKVQTIIHGVTLAALRELQERRKADSEPVAWTWHYREQWYVTSDERRAEFVAKDGDVAVLPLYRHAQPAPSSESITVTDDMAYAFHHALTDSMIGADDVEEIKTGLRAVFANLTAPVVSAEYPDRLPCSVLLEPGLRFGKGIKTSTMLAALARRAVYESDMAALSPEERAEFQAGIEDFKALIAQPAPVVPDDVLDALRKVARIRLDLNDFDGDRRGIADCLGDAEEALIEVVNRCAAMLAAAPQEVR